MLKLTTLQQGRTLSGNSLLGLIATLLFLGIKSLQEQKMSYLFLELLPHKDQIGPHLECKLAGVE